MEFFELFLKRVPSKSDDKLGDLNPTGSNYKYKTNCQKINILF